MSEELIPILLVDDEPINLVMLNNFLKNGSYQPVSVENGQQAWELLQDPSNQFATVLLDRRMPVMDGMELLKLIRNEPRLNNLPVIMQTASSTDEDILEGLQAGAHYYLTKPFDKKTLLSIIDTAVEDYRRFIHIKDELDKTASTLGMMKQGSFTFKTLEEGRNLAALLSSVCPEPQPVAIGLAELMINAVEHGNLDITYEEKGELLKAANWEKEITRRSAMPEYCDRQVKVNFRYSDKLIRVEIQDEGNGFDWQRYLSFDASRAFDSHGRGIAMANNLSFSRLEYRGNGNEVIAEVILEE